MDARRPRTRLWIGIVLVALLAVGTPFLLAALKSDRTPAANPTSNTSEGTQETEQPTIRPTPTPTPPPATETTPAQLPINGAVSGSCLPRAQGVVCTLGQVPAFSNDGYAQYPGGKVSEFLLITCTDANCQASSAPKNQIPCVQGDGQTVFCANVTDRERVYRAVDATVYHCKADGTGILCPKRDGYTVANGSLAIRGTAVTVPVQLALTETGRLSAYVVQAPAGFTAYGNCSANGSGDITCRPLDASSVVPTGVQCTPVSDEATRETTLTCVAPVGTVPDTLTVWCPGSDAAGTYCHTTQGGMNVNRWDCTRNPANERTLVCRYRA